MSMNETHRWKIVDSPSLEQFYDDMNRYTTAEYRTVPPYVIELDKWEMRKFDTTLGKLTVWVALDPEYKAPDDPEKNFEWTLIGQAKADEYDECEQQYRALTDMDSVEEFCEENLPDAHWLEKLDLNPDASDTVDFEEDSPLAIFNAAFKPGWRWEVYRIDGRDVEVAVETDDDGEPVYVETDLYFGRVNSPMTMGMWDYGNFTAHELRQAGAFRIDEDTGDWP